MAEMGLGCPLGLSWQLGPGCRPAMDGPERMAPGCAIFPLHFLSFGLSTPVTDLIQALPTPPCCTLHALSLSLCDVSAFPPPAASPTSPDKKAKRHEVKSDPTPFGLRGSVTRPPC